MNLTFSQRSDLKDCVQSTLMLNQKMNDTLVGIIKCASEKQIVRTDKQRIKDFDGKVTHRSTIYAYVFDQGLEQYTEEKVSAVAVFENKTIGVLLCGDVEFGTDTTDDILLESSEWYTVDGGMLCSNATLYNLCENIEEYL